MNKRFKRPMEAPGVTVDTVVFSVDDSQLSVLLVSRSEEPFEGFLALPGGFLQQSETTEEAAKRVLKDKAGISNVFIEQLYTFDSPTRDPRGRILAVTYMALVPIQKLDKLSAGAQIQPVSEVKELAFDHTHILEYAVKRIRSKLEYTNAAYSLLPKRFTLSELQLVYEAILNQPIDKRNFRKKIQTLNIIRATSEMQRGKKHRPARLYEFIKRGPQELANPAFYKQ